ncbi:MAG: restriction endonuclease, partial [Geminicoccaceae bacterium]|nr:restriction endonuclease [Geminicoccaceae bacterium]
RLLARPDDPSDRYRIYERWYGVGRLRELAESRRGRDSFADLWIGLSVLFRALEEPEEAEKLGLSALDGDLFAAAACGDLEEARIANADLLDAVLELSTFVPLEGRGRKRKAGARRRVRFSALDVEELGSVYESLLDLHPAIDLARGSFELCAGSERKTTGSYYTPDPLVQELVKSALDPVLEARLKDAATPEEKERALLSLRVLDPAAGSGHFLLAAARRIARELARARSGEHEPAPSVRRAALRDVVRHCLFAVDKNPLAVDLAKVALWIESQTPGAPLSFLDHRIRRGDSLLGVFDLSVLADGIPDEAWAPLEGDDKAVAQGLQRVNRAERSGSQRALFDHRLEQHVKALARELAAIAAMPETSIEEVRAKREAFAAWHRSEARSRLALACDLWCAAFFLPKRTGTEKVVPTTRHLALALEKGEAGLEPRMLAQVRAVAEEVGFFHWPLEFPEAMAAGGFDVVLGNPPWDVSQFSEEEFFATRAPDIAALEGAARKAAIARLSSERPELAQAHRDALRRIAAANQLIRYSSRFPLTAKGKLNLYALFAELFSKLYREGGRAGLIVPTGIATDASTSGFFGYLVTDRRLASLFDFENRDGIFPAVHKSYKFALLTLARRVREPAFLCFATAVDQLRDSRRHFTLSAEDIARINPNTKTLPVFRSEADAEITKKIYARVPVLVDESKGDAGNPWKIDFRQGLFNMTSHSGLFRTARALEAAGAHRRDQVWVEPSGKRWLPLYEAKMIHQFDHRWAGYDAAGEATLDVEDSRKADPSYEPAPRYWVPEAEVEERLRAKGWNRGWLLGWRDICRSTDERTVIASVLPRVGVGHSLPLFFCNALKNFQLFAAHLANWNALVLDFVARQKVGGTHLTYSYLKQLPFLPPPDFAKKDLAFIVPRVLELTYTSRSLAAWARDLGYEGEPFPWDPERRAGLRAELDAYYAFLYGLSRDELRYVLDPADVMGADYPTETFRVLKEKEERTYGEYRTRRLVLEAWDRFVAEGVFDPERESGLSPNERDRARLGRLRGGA